MERSHSGVVERAREDMEAGRLWKARDRLVMAVREVPTDQDALETLGEVYFAMGDQPAAGRFWFLTERSGSEVEEAMAAFEERWGGNLGEKLKVVPFNGKVEDYPPAARERLRALGERARHGGVEWPRAETVEEHKSSDDSIGLGGWMVGALLAVLGPGLWLLGIAAAVDLLAEWLL